VGSEGGLAFSAALDLKLWPIKPRKVLGICQFPTFRAAMEAARTWSRSTRKRWSWWTGR
jgi:FAD/FMN-containing dehydrogenase